MKKCILFLLALLCIHLNAIAQVQPTDTDGDGYINISTLAHLRWVSENSSSWASKFELDSNINAAPTATWNNGQGFSPIGNDVTNFTGKLDGNGFVIDSLFINRPETNDIGLLGTSKDAQISNIGITNCQITGDTSVGSLLGACIYVTVYNCYSTGIVSGKFSVGGLSGQANYTTMDNCYSKNDILGIDCLGGLVGMNYYSKISNSYSNGKVSGSGIDVAGLIGCDNWSTINNCYSTGKVSGSKNFGGLVGFNANTKVINCFWDTITSGLTTSSGGTGKTTAEMKTKSTFTSAGWDFDSTWAIAADYNNGYPNLDGKNDPSGIIEIYSGNLIYPQPASDELFVKLSETTEATAFIRLYDQTGQLALTSETSARDGLIRLNTSALSSDIYQMIITIAGKNYTEKVVIVK